MKYTEFKKWSLAILGGMVLVYSVLVLGFVATTPDLGLRCLIDDPERDGPNIELVSSVFRADGERAPKIGDVITEIGRQPINTFLDFTYSLVRLRSTSIPPGGHIDDDLAMLEMGELLPPVVVKDYRDGERWVEVKFRGANDPVIHRCWLQVQSLPPGELALSFTWFLLYLGIFAIAALAAWTRPFDTPARLFFVMSIVNVGAFVGGYNWWLISGSPALVVPFIVCALLLPITTLHFFLVYPERKSWMSRFPRLMLVVLYTIPVIAIVTMLSVILYAHWQTNHGGPAAQVQGTLDVLGQLISCCLGMASLQFGGALVAMLHSYVTARTPLVRDQVRWLLWAGLLAGIPVAYTLYLAITDKVAFALGQASLPMFAASLLFMCAYAVGIARYKLMLVDQLLHRGMLYYGMSLGIAAAYSVSIALSSLAGLSQMSAAGHAWAGVATVMLAVLLLGWFRDRLQQIVDRRFFHEKYPLDRALFRMSEAGRLLEPEALADRLLASCRDVLGAERAALYLKDGDSGDFRMIAVVGAWRAPVRMAASHALVSGLSAESSVMLAGQRDAASLEAMGAMDVDLVHALEVEGEVAGVLLLAARRNGAPFAAEDLAFLTALSQITSVALHSARVHAAFKRVNEDVRLKAERIVEQQRLISMLQSEITSRANPVIVTEAEPFHRGLIRGDSPAIVGVLETVRKVSSSQSSVLVRGESGTGKELLAQAIHENSPRRAGPMISVHCGALSPGLLESELFGHVKGAFTGAHRDRMGRFELANSGTLFLDEIGDISLETQIKLLRVLQERTFEAVGGSNEIQVDVRLIAATHQNLEQLIQEGRFREDLFYRLNVISITLPPLRERSDDIVDLALHFLSRTAQRVGKTITHLDDEALHALVRYRWPGNIRELENVIERAVVLTDGPNVTLRDLPPHVVHDEPIQTTRGGPRPAQALPGSPHPMPASHGAREPHATREGKNTEERTRLVDALARTSGNKAEAARLLGLPRSTFFSKLKKFGLS